MPISKIVSNSLGSALTFTGQQTIPTINLTGGQITFPATAVPSADANTLDDYEQGTFTPALSRDGTAPTISYSLQSGQYTKIGNVVTVYIAIIAASVSSAGSGNTTITGLPFSNSGVNYSAPGAIGYNDAGVNTLSGSWLSSATVYFRSGTKSSGNDSSGWQGGYMYMAITYLTS